MDILIGVVVGLVIGIAGTYLVARNNQKKFNRAMDIDPKAKWDEMIDDLKDRIKR